MINLCNSLLLVASMIIDLIIVIQLLQIALIFNCIKFYKSESAVVIDFSGTGLTGAAERFIRIN